MDINGDYLEEEMNDFKARVFMHELDHLWGFLITSFSVSFGRIFSKDVTKTPELNKILKEANEIVKEKIKEYEEYIEKTTKKTQNTEDNIENNIDYCIREVYDKEFEVEFGDAMYAAFNKDCK